MTIYRLPPPRPDNLPTTSIVKIEGECITVIPIDETSHEYQQYLRWVAQGNSPEPHQSSDSVPTPSANSQPLLIEALEQQQQQIQALQDQLEYLKGLANQQITSD